MSKNIIRFLFVGCISCLIFGCASRSERMAVSNESYSGKFVKKAGESTDLSLQDLSSLAKSMAEEFLGEYQPEKNRKYVIALSDASKTNSNVEYFSQEFTTILRKSGSYVVSASMGKIKEEMLNTVRDKRNDEEFNEDTKIEKGGLKMSDFSLVIDISKEKETIRDDVTRVDYRVFVRIVDLEKGVEVWSGQKVFSKEASLNDIKKQKEQEREYAQTTGYYGDNGSYSYSRSKATPSKEEAEEEELKDTYKGDYFMMELKLGIGKRNTPVPLWLDDPTNLAFMVGGKLGWTYRWSQKYALTFYGEYEATFQGNGSLKKKEHYYDDNEEKFMTTNSVGLGLRMQMSYFYLSGGALYDTNEFGSDFLNETYANVNPYVGVGMIFSGKHFGVLVGGRYVVSLGNGEYLNRGFSGDVGIIIAI